MQIRMQYKCTVHHRIYELYPAEQYKSSLFSGVGPDSRRRVLSCNPHYSAHYLHLHSTLHCTALHYTALSSTELHCIELPCNSFHSSQLHYIAIYCTVMNCTKLQGFALFSSVWPWNLMPTRKQGCLQSTWRFGLRHSFRLVDIHIWRQPTRGIMYDKGAQYSTYRDKLRSYSESS